MGASGSNFYYCTIFGNVWICVRGSMHMFVITISSNVFSVQFKNKYIHIVETSGSEGAVCGTGEVVARKDKKFFFLLY